VALTPSAGILYVANARSNSVSVIEHHTNTVIKTIADVGIEPRGIAITNSGGADTAETVYVTQFLALPAPGKQDGRTMPRSEKVTVISAANQHSYGLDYLKSDCGHGIQGGGRRVSADRATGGSGRGGLQIHHGGIPESVETISRSGGNSLCTEHGASPNGPVGLM